MKAKLPQITLVYDRRKTASTERKASVEIRITYNYKQKYISTGIMLYPSQWKNGLITNCPDIIQLSQMLEKQLTDVRQIILDMLKEGEINLSVIANKLDQISPEKIDMYTFFRERTEIRTYKKSKDTKERYDRFIRLFKEYGKINNFEDITEKSLIAYDKHLLSEGMKSNSKWNNYHRFLNSFILDAMDAGYMKKNPYKWINIDKEKSLGGIDKYLTLNEFNQIKNATMPTESLERVRDLFVFQTYLCLRYSDLALFDASYIQTIKGMKVYKRPSKKTKKPFIAPIVPAALEILEKYKYKLPIISNVKYNLYLKMVAQYANIDKDLSTHWARHTGATILLNEGIEMKYITKICGHSSTKITEQVYAKMLDETVVNAVEKLKDEI